MEAFERVYFTELPEDKTGLMLVCVKGDRNEVSSDYGRGWRYNVCT